MDTAVWTAKARASLCPLVQEDEPGPMASPFEAAPVRQSRGLRMLRVAGRLVQGTIIAAVSLAFLLVAALPAVGHKALIVTSGSMEPLLSAGDAAIIQLVPPEDLVAGDVITYSGYGGDQLTTHRIVRRVHLKSGLHFQTKGDANAAPDADLAPAAGVVGRYVVGIPHAGRVLLFTAQPHGRLLIVGLPALLTLASEARYLLGRCRRSPSSRRLVTAPATGVMIVAIATAVGVTMATGAVFTDVDTAGENTFTTGTFPA